MVITKRIQKIYYQHSAFDGIIGHDSNTAKAVNEFESVLPVC
jgi:hypothetical protein